jgi:hypothetical protein
MMAELVWGRNDERQRAGMGMTNHYVTLVPKKAGSRDRSTDLTWAPGSLHISGIHSSAASQDYKSQCHVLCAQSYRSVVRDMALQRLCPLGKHYSCDHSSILRCTTR